MVRAKRVGILTAGGDSPGLNAAIRGFGKAAIGAPRHAARRVPRRVPRPRRGPLRGARLQRARRDPHRRRHDPRARAATSRTGCRSTASMRDMTEAIVRTYRRHRLDALRVHRRQRDRQELAAAGQGRAQHRACCPRPSTTTSSRRTRPSASRRRSTIATEAIDRLHSTAHSHHRIILAEVMGHRAGWLTLAAGIAGGRGRDPDPGDPLPDRERRGRDPAPDGVGDQLLHRRRGRGRPGRRDATGATWAWSRGARRRAPATPERAAADAELAAFDADHTGHSLRLARQLEALTGLESRVSILGYVQRGGHARRRSTGCWPRGSATPAPTSSPRAPSA